MKRTIPLMAFLALSSTLSANLYPNIQRNNSSQKSFPYYNQSYYNQNPNNAEDAEYSDTSYYYYQNPQNAQDQNNNQDGWTAESFEYSQNVNPSYYNQGTQSQGSATQGYYNQGAQSQGSASQGFNQNRMLNSSSSDINATQSFNQNRMNQLNSPNAINNGVQSSYFTTEIITEADKTVRDFPQDRGITPFDNQLNKKIRDKVSSGWVWNSYKGVALNTSNGVVTLDGTVANKEDEKKLIDHISKIEGVKSVNSNLTIQK